MVRNLCISVLVAKLEPTLNYSAFGWALELFKLQSICVFFIGYLVMDFVNNLYVDSSVIASHRILKLLVFVKLFFAFGL